MKSTRKAKSINYECLNTEQLRAYTLLLQRLQQILQSDRSQGSMSITYRTSVRQLPRVLLVVRQLSVVSFPPTSLPL